jgi:hypothetical protein
MNTEVNSIAEIRRMDRQLYAELWDGDAGNRRVNESARRTIFAKTISFLLSPMKARLM